jgi:hypothetical protein
MRLAAQASAPTFLALIGDLTYADDYDNSGGSEVYDGLQTRWASNSSAGQQ